MNITFLGGVREVTGSMHFVSTGSDRILLDCGLFQGRRKESTEKNRVLPFDPGILTNIVLSHAHIDHSGRIPLMVKENFRGRVICTRATMDACAYLLPDSGHIQESDAEYLNYKTLRSSLSRIRSVLGEQGVGKAEIRQIKALLKKNRHELNVEMINDLIDACRIEAVVPLYTREDAEKAMTWFDGFPYKTPVTVGKNMTCTFYEAGHILGSAITILSVRRDGRTVNIGFTGDIGRFGKPILKDPALRFDDIHRKLDLLIMESTYGDREHEPVGDLASQLRQVLTETFERGGCVVIPSFAFGRTQELVYVLHQLYDAGEVTRVPVFIDSPLAIKLTRVFGEHPEVYDRETHEVFLEKGKNPFSFKQVHFSETVADSMALMQEKKPHVVIASSGMCEAGRILHHLRYKMHNPLNTILIVGYMAQHTLGRRIVDQGMAWEASGRTGEPPTMRLLNKEYPLKAHVRKIGGFSGHGDRNEMLAFLRRSNLDIRRIALVHGEEDQTLAFADTLTGEGYRVIAPKRGETLHID